MLNAIRSRTNSWVVKIFLGLIILSFAVWGVGDIFRGGSDPAVATVGGTKILASTFGRDLNLEINRIRTISRGQIDAEQARALGVVQQTLDSAITRAALDEQADAFGIAVPEVRVAEFIRTARDFQNELGQFDRRLFDYVLRQLAMNEAQYVVQMQLELGRQQIIGSLISGLIPPDVMIDTLLRYREERRQADVVIVDAADMLGIDTPDEEQLRGYYDQNPDSFTAPAYRKITYVALRPADLIDEIDIDEERARDEYSARIPELERPDRRDVDMIVLAGEDAAATAYERILKGEDFLTVGRELSGLGETDLRFGMVTRNELPESLSDKVFALTEGRIGGPYETPFGWNLVRINGVEEGGTPSFEDVRAEIEADLKVQHAIDAVYDLSTLFEDSRAGGDTLEESAAVIGVQTKVVNAIDSRGLNPAGDYEESQLNTPEFLSNAFEIGVGEESPLIEAPGNVLFALRVDRVTDPALRPLDQVRDQAAQAWLSNQKRIKAEETAKTIAEAAAIANDLESAAQAQNLSITRTSTFMRDGRDLEPSLSAQVVGAIFDLEQSDVSDVLNGGPNRFVVAKLISVDVPDPKTRVDERENLDRELETALANEIVGAYQIALRNRLGVRVDNALIQQLF